ncbi:MAG: GNAT family N-acetyltransferase [Devosia sp.]|uniref:GNAT family N-acetyltransferase n=1 Tax=Devosia sp. TaxID=1871048 RepID=UPI0024C9A65E|nr:GNAT family N-acetyltransferase [Devosia sp.]UYN98497.1 MAG: GNAT family N-acetyltransferase [Devosia sp.]
MNPSLDEVLNLDLPCLEAPEGGPLDADAHREALTRSLERSKWAHVRRDGQLVAYGYLWPLSDDVWFVGGLAIHPHYRNASVTAELARAMSGLVRAVGAVRLESHVRRGNKASLRLHERLGFVVTRESDRAVALRADSAALLARLPG